MTALVQARPQGRVPILQQVRKFARHIDAATPPHRDRAVDALRALSCGTRPRSSPSARSGCWRAGCRAC